MHTNWRSTCRFFEPVSGRRSGGSGGGDGSGSGSSDNGNESGGRWCLRRNCSLRPAQAAATLGGLALLMLSTGVWFGFVLHLWLVLPFALLWAGAVMAAFFRYARHAADREVLTLTPSRLVVEIEEGGRQRIDILQPRGVTVMTDEDGALLLCSAGRRVRVGRHMPAGARERFADDLRRRLRACGAAS